MNKGLVSVIVCSYNHEKYINQCLDSIKLQSYNKIQLIVADDASKDNSVEIFENWLKENDYPAEKNFHQKNTGLAITLNECIKLAKGEYIKIIAADDYLYPESIEHCINALEELGTDYGMVFTDFWAVDDNNQPAEFFLNYENKSFFNPDNSLKKEQLIKYNCIISPTVLIRKDTLLATGEYNPSMLLEDHDRWLRINEIKKIHFIHKKLCYYRVLPTGVSSTRKAKMEEEDLYLRMKYDKDGINKSEIYRNLLAKYLRHEKISSFVISHYLEYPHKIKRLSFVLKYYIPPILYRVFIKIYNKL